METRVAPAKKFSGLLPVVP